MPIVLVAQANWDRFTREEMMDYTMPSNRITPDVEMIRGHVEGDQFEPVALLNCTGLDDAFRYTNSIDQHWSDEALAAGKLLSLGPKQDRVRSTSVGDIMVVDGKAFVVASIGFVELPRDIAIKVANQFCAATGRETI